MHSSLVITLSVQGEKVSRCCEKDDYTPRSGWKARKLLRDPSSLTRRHGVGVTASSGVKEKGYLTESSGKDGDQSEGSSSVQRLIDGCLFCGVKNIGEVSFRLVRLKSNLSHANCVIRKLPLHTKQVTKQVGVQRSTSTPTLFNKLK